MSLWNNFVEQMKDVAFGTSRKNKKPAAKTEPPKQHSSPTAPDQRKQAKHPVVPFETVIFQPEYLCPKCFHRTNLANPHRPNCACFHKARFVDDQIPPEYNCGICLEPLLFDDVVHGPCKHVFDGPCIRRWIESNPTCPVDRSSMVHTQLQKARTAASAVGKLRIHCLFEMNGCNWIGELAQFTSHATSCQKATLRCPFEGCGFRAIREVLVAHIVHCEHRLLQCEYCRYRCRSLETPAHTDICSGRRVDALIRQYTTYRHKANVGLLHEVVLTAISSGAPAYNRGEVDICFFIYQRTARALCEAFFPENSAKPMATAGAKKLLHGMRSAVLRTSTPVECGPSAAAAAAAAGVDRHVWALRFAFDKVTTAYRAACQHVLDLLTLGESYLARGQFAEAAEAFADATEELTSDIAGVKQHCGPPDCFTAPLALCHAMYMLRRFRDAGRALQMAVHYLTNFEDARGIPLVRLIKLDLGRLYAAMRRHNELFAELCRAASAHPEDGDLKFLVGALLTYDKPQQPMPGSAAMPVSPNGSAPPVKKGDANH